MFLFNGRSGTSSLYATGMAVGTLMCTLPELAGVGPVHDVGLALSGFFAILLLLTWFEAFSRLGSRTIIVLGGCSFLLSAIGVFVILSLPVETASIAISALPLVSFTLLPRPTEASDAAPNSKATLSAILSQAVSWKTLLGIALSFFVIGAMGTLAPGLGVTVELSSVYLGIPAFLMLVFISIAWACPRRLDASTLFKLLLIAVASIAFLLVYAGTTNLSLVFFLYITADVLLWSVLALAAKKTPVAPHAAFASHYGLSERETDVFALWVTGHGLKHIQNTLFISESTVKTHLRNIYRKCDTHNRAEIIALFEGQR